MSSRTPSSSDKSRVWVAPADRVVPVLPAAGEPIAEAKGGMWIVALVLIVLVLLFFGVIWFLGPR